MTFPKTITLFTTILFCIYVFYLTKPRVITSGDRVQFHTTLAFPDYVSIPPGTKIEPFLDSFYQDGYYDFTESEISRLKLYLLSPKFNEDAVKRCAALPQLDTYWSNNSIESQIKKNKELNAWEIFFSVPGYSYRWFSASTLSFEYDRAPHYYFNEEYTDSIYCYDRRSAEAIDFNDQLVQCVHQLVQEYIAQMRKQPSVAVPD